MEKATMPPIIELHNLSFAYGDGGRCALRDVNLRIDEGSLVGVIGPSGSGKTTLAAALSGAIPHHHRGKLYGSAVIGGMDTCEASLTDISRLVGSVLQDIDAQMVASIVEDELLFGLENFGVPHELIEGRLQGALEAVGIEGLRHREIATLSGGQKQKVAIAAILALQPRILVLDEPTAALDPVSSRAVFDILRHLNRHMGVTIVVIEQMIALLAEYCDRIVVLDEGAVALDGAPREVFARAERLKEIGVDSPRTVRISNSLAAEGLASAGEPCLNVDEAEGLIRSILPAPGKTGDEGAHGRLDEPGPRRMPGARRMPDPVVELSDVGFSYGTGAASVEGISLCVHPGETLAIVGQNGAGKTTLTKLVCGLLRPTKGTVRVAGIDTARARVSQIAAHAATLFQNPDRQLCQDTVLDEVAFGLTLHGTARTEALERARAVIERFGLPADEAPFALSRGQRQMVALASVIVLEPELIILDEPTCGLDYRECMTVMETVARAARAGSAVIMVCHDMEVVSDFADTAALMADGRIIAHGYAHELFARRDLMERAGTAAPHVIDLVQRLTPDFPALAGITEVSALVGRVKELTRHA